MSAIELSAVSLKTGTIREIRRKTGSWRIVPLWPETLTVIRNYLAVRPTPKPEAEGVLFVTKRRLSWLTETTREKQTAGR